MEPELMTADEWVNLIGLSAWSKAQGTIRERGMIAPEPEPVDPLLDEARNVVGDYAATTKGYEIYESAYRQGFRDDDSEVVIALTALRRNLERPTLTRQMVREAVEIASRGAPMRETFVDCVYDLLVERLK